MISEEDKKIMKITQPNTRTFLVKKFPPGQVAAMLQDEFEKRKIKNVAIKGYVGPYKTYSNAGTVNLPGHGRDSLPKALKKM